ncbi:antigen 5 like allergen Cul n 1-like [Bradysia coprophila]|uniref:antigen 5 like allergen Cul n 1-like n=1 Tax=Bradysia coprophila TaxID=38358 RepID=UPI00187DD55A|nr:antigen 5 like allergen Cul n 1-like [Bradysia coprophila]
MYIHPKYMTVLLTCIFPKLVITAYNYYCQAHLCRPNSKHIGCGNTGEFGPNCPSERKLVPMTVGLKAYLLEKHNRARCDIANGKIRGYKSANGMPEMGWDDELAKLAEYNAKTCIYGHDECVSTATHRYAGQNIAIVMSTLNYFESKRAIDLLFKAWFDEYRDCDMTYIDKYRRSDTGKKIGHFTQIVRAGASRMGCALTSFANSRKNVYIVCNYSLANILGRKAYTTGMPCSACNEGCSLTYPGLCNTTEVIPL